MNKSKRNYYIIGVFAFLVSLALFYWILSSSEYTGEFKFQYCDTPNVGGHMSAIGSVLFYSFVGFLFGTLFMAFAIIFIRIFFVIIHLPQIIKEDISCLKRYGDELSFGNIVAMICVPILTVVLVILHTCGLFIVSPYPF